MEHGKNEQTKPQSAEKQLKQSSGPAGKELGSHPSHPYKKKKPKQTENQQLFLHTPEN